MVILIHCESDGKQGVMTKSDFSILQGSMEDAIRQVQNDTVREARDLLHDFRDVKLCQAKPKQCKHTVEKKILSKVSSVCQSVCNPSRVDGSVEIPRTLGVANNH